MFRSRHTTMLGQLNRFKMAIKSFSTVNPRTPLKEPKVSERTANFTPESSLSAAITQLFFPFCDPSTALTARPQSFTLILISIHGNPRSSEAPPPSNRPSITARISIGRLKRVYLPTTPTSTAESEPLSPDQVIVCLLWYDANCRRE